MRFGRGSRSVIAPINEREITAFLGYWPFNAVAGRGIILNSDIERRRLGRIDQKARHGDYLVKDDHGTVRIERRFALVADYEAAGVE